MNHSEAMDQMAVERYLLDELGPDARDEFEEHMFDCSDCAFDVRAGVAFVNEAKVQLPPLVTTDAATAKAAARQPEKQKQNWFASLLAFTRPMIMVPACALLLAVVGYQNLVTLPGLRSPHLVAVSALRGATRGAEHQQLTTSRAQGLSLPVDLLPVDMNGGTKYASYAFALIDPQGKTTWTGSVPGADASQGQQQALVIPGAPLQNGTYTVTVDGVDAGGTKTPVERYVFDLKLTDK